MTSNAEKAQSIFLSAIEEHEPEQWPAFLDFACADDVDLRAQVEKLLRAHAKLGTFHEKPAENIGPTLDVAPIAEKVGMKIGRYKLVHEIGHGGMGVVYMAVQKEPVKRKVALKIIKPGMDTKEVVSRFEAERQALALMDHQSIATVLDGGSTESGRPYFVMELVEGTPIGEYCDACRYTTRQRLELFVQVCQAVQHAHLKGVIHRDIKPSNIMVTTYDTVAVPKVIDFGIAKAVHQPLTDSSVYTNISQMVGTPLYMSPEQAQRTAQDVDTRTDVYSLGVLLYELLTGTTPFDKERFKESGLDEVKRIIREEEPPKPSTRLSTVDAALNTVVENHKTDIRTLTRELSGELDWIVMKSLEKDRTRRYESASDFAKDVQRHLDDEPVEACPPSTTYRLKKFARRNRVAIITASIIAMTLILGLAGTTWQAIVATEAKEREQEQATIANEQRQAAEANYVRAREAVKQMLTRVADEELAAIPEMKEVRKQLLEDAAAFYTELIKLNGRDPMAYSERGHVYDLLTQYGKALPDYERALDLDPDNPEFHHGLAWLLFHCADVPHRDLHRALVHATRAVELAPKNYQYHRTVLAIDMKLGHRAEALGELRKIQELRPNSASMYFATAEISRRMGDLKGALANVRKAAELETGGPFLHLFMAEVLLKLGQDEEALAAANKAFEVNPKPNSTRTFNLHDVRGGIYWRLGMHAAALDDFNKSLDLAPFRSYTHKRRAAAHFHFKDYAKALADIAKAVELNPEDMSNLTWIAPDLVAECEDEPFRQGLLELADKTVEATGRSAAAYATRGMLRAKLGKVEGALADYQTAIDIDPKNDANYRQRGAIYAEQEQWSEATQDYAKARELGHDGVVNWYRYALLQLGGKEADQYRDTCAEMLAAFEGTETAGDAHWLAWTCALAPDAVADFTNVVSRAEHAVQNGPESVSYRTTLGAILYRAGRLEEAVKRLTEADKLAEQPDAAAKSSPAYTWYFLAMAHHKLGDDEEAKKWFQKANEWTDKVMRDHEEGTATAPWNRRLTLKLLREEAEAMIEKDEK